MGHYNQIVFSEIKEKSIEEISRKIEEVLEVFSIAHTIGSNFFSSKEEKKRWDLIWKYTKEEADSSYGELICYIGLRSKAYSVVIGDSSTFRINRSEKIFEKFCDLCQAIAERLDVQYAIYSEEPTSAELFIPSYLNRALDILELHRHYNMHGLVIIQKSKIERSKAENLTPLNGKFNLTNSGFYIYKMF